MPNKVNAKDFPRKTRSALVEQIKSPTGLSEVKGACRANGVAIRTAYRYMAGEKDNSWEHDDICDHILAQDGLSIFADDDGNPASPLNEFSQDYQKDLFHERCFEIYNRFFQPSRLLGKTRSSISAIPPGDPGNPYAELSPSDYVEQPVIEISSITSRVNIVTPTNIQIPVLQSPENTAAAELIDNPEGDPTQVVTIRLGKQTVQMERLGIGLQWSGDFEDSPLSAAAIALFAAELGVNDTNKLVRQGLKIVTDAKPASQTADDVTVSEWTGRGILDLENSYSNGKRVDVIVGLKDEVLDYEDARLRAYGNRMQTTDNTTLGNNDSKFVNSYFYEGSDEQKTETGLQADKLYLINRRATLGLAMKSADIVITDDYNTQVDMFRRFFRRWAGWYLQDQAPIIRAGVPA